MTISLGFLASYSVFFFFLVLGIGLIIANCAEVIQINAKNIIACFCAAMMGFVCIIYTSTHKTKCETLYEPYQVVFEYGEKRQIVSGNETARLCKKRTHYFGEYVIKEFRWGGAN